MEGSDPLPSFLLPDGRSDDLRRQFLSTTTAVLRGVIGHDHGVLVEPHVLEVGEREAVDVAWVRHLFHDFGLVRSHAAANDVDQLVALVAP